jgi:hypothetical protein
MTSGGSGGSGRSGGSGDSRGSSGSGSSGGAGSRGGDGLDGFSWERLEELFEQAQALPIEARDSFLHEQCANQPALRAQIDVLLAADDGDRALHIERLVVDARPDGGGLHNGGLHNGGLYGGELRGAGPYGEGRGG